MHCLLQRRAHWNEMLSALFQKQIVRLADQSKKWKKASSTGNHVFTKRSMMPLLIYVTDGNAWSMMAKNMNNVVPNYILDTNYGMSWNTGPDSLHAFTCRCIENSPGTQGNGKKIDDASQPSLPLSLLSKQLQSSTSQCKETPFPHQRPPLV